MIKDLITDLKISAMDLKSEVKDVIHDITTKPPVTVQEDYSKLDKQRIDVGELDYMNLGWNSAPAQMTASKIDMIADKISFVSEVIQQGLLAFDSIEEELKNCVRSTYNSRQLIQMSFSHHLLNMMFYSFWHFFINSFFNLLFNFFIFYHLRNRYRC